MKGIINIEESFFLYPIDSHGKMLSEQNTFERQTVTDSIFEFVSSFDYSRKLGNSVFVSLFVSTINLIF